MDTFPRSSTNGHQLPPPTIANSSVRQTYHRRERSVDSGVNDDGVTTVGFDNGGKNGRRNRYNGGATGGNDNAAFEQE